MHTRPAVFLLEVGAGRTIEAMGEITVAFDDYQTGRLPDVCVLTGTPTEDRMVLRTPIHVNAGATKSAGRFFTALDGLVTTLDPRAPRDVLLGRLPVNAAALAHRTNLRRLWDVTTAVAIAVFVIALGMGATWSGAVVIISLAGVVYAATQRRHLRGEIPRPTLIGAGSQVHLSNVHESFVAAVQAG